MNGAKHRFSLILTCLLLTGLTVVYPFLLYTDNAFVTKWREWYIETAMGTMTHQWLATSFIPHDMIEKVIKTTVPAELLDENTKYLVNPTGRFVIGGPQGDSGLTGRKIIVDTYGGSAPHGGGAFSGKDPTKVDRSAAYAARYVAKNIVAAGLAEKCQVQLAYAIGVAHPVSVMVETFGTGKVSDEALAAWVTEHVDMRPGVMIRRFGLRSPIYHTVSCYGHFGENARSLPWEQTDLSEELRKAF